MSEENLSTRFEVLLARLEVHKSKILIGSLVILLISAGVYVVRGLREQREEKANAALFALNDPFSGVTNRVAAAGHDYSALAEEFSGTQAAQRALLLSAGTLFSEENNFQRAREQFEEFQAQYPSSAWLPVAVYGTAVCLEAEGKTNECMTAYRDFSERYPDDPIKFQAQLSLARLFTVQAKPQEALTIYDGLTENQTNISSWARQANQLKQELLQRHPELAPPPEPDPTPATLPATGQSLLTLPTPLLPSANDSLPLDIPQATEGSAPEASPGSEFFVPGISILPADNEAEAAVPAGSATPQAAPDSKDKAPGETETP